MALSHQQYKTPRQNPEKDLYLALTKDLQIEYDNALNRFDIQLLQEYI